MTVLKLLLVENYRLNVQTCLIQEGPIEQLRERAIWCYPNVPNQEVSHHIWSPFYCKTLK